MAQLSRIRLADGRVLRPGDWTVSPLYSTVDIATGTLATLDAFSYGKGGEIPGSIGAAANQLRIATLKDTNMEGAGGILAENEQLLIYSLCVELIQRAPNTTQFFTGQEAWAPDPPLVSMTNAQRVLQDTLVKLRIANTKYYLNTPLGFLPAARGVFHAGMGSARSAGTSYANGVAVGYNGGVSEGSHRRFATPHEVLPGEAFVVQFEFPRGSVQNLNFGSDTSARISARIFTRGLRMRPVA